MSVNRCASAWTCGQRCVLVLLLGSEHLQFRVAAGAILRFGQVAIGAGSIERLCVREIAVAIMTERSQGVRDLDEGTDDRLAIGRFRLEILLPRFLLTCSESAAVKYRCAQIGPNRPDAAGTGEELVDEAGLLRVLRR